MENPKAKLPFPPERLDLILLALSGQQPIKKLCDQAGVSRTIFYRWMRRVKEASLQALETQVPGPKKHKDPKKLPEKVEKLEKRVLKLSKKVKHLRDEKEHLEKVVGVAQRVIRRQRWADDDLKVKKKSTPPPGAGNSTFKNGPKNGMKPGLESLFHSGESAAPPTGGGSMAESKAEGENPEK